MIKVVFWEVPTGAISRFQNDEWDREPVLTLHHENAKWVPAHTSESGYIWLQSGTALEVPMPRIRRPNVAAVADAHWEIMTQAREKLIEIVGEITPKVYEGTLAIVHRGTMYGSFGLHVSFGLGFTEGNAFEDSLWSRPNELWCPKEIDFGVEPPDPSRRTRWDLLNQECAA